jgi:hypothetical protein
MLNERGEANVRPALAIAAVRGARRRVDWRLAAVGFGDHDARAAEAATDQDGAKTLRSWPRRAVSVRHRTVSGADADRRTLPVTAIVCCDGPLMVADEDPPGRERRRRTCVACHFRCRPR